MKTTTVFIGEYLEWTGSTSTMKLHYYAGGRRIALRSAGALLWLVGDHLGSTTVTADAGGGSATMQLYKAWGEIRTGSLNALATRYTFTGQAAEDSLGLMFYRARWYDPLLGRFVSADSIVPGVFDPLAYDRYAYVNNSPVVYNDPSGHWMCDQYDPSCAETPQETAQYQIMAAGYQPDSACASDPLCGDSYTTIVEVTVLLGQAPMMDEILYMTVGTEYYAYQAKHKDVRTVGQEGLARNYYEACGTDGCYGNELYAFLAGFQPWYGRPYVMGDGSASARAAHLVNDGLHNDFAGTGEDLWEDVGQILDTWRYAANQGWTRGKMDNEPWQWFGPFLLDPSTEPTFGYGAGNAAILSVDMGIGYVFWMFTGAQDWSFNHNKDYWVMK
jgi:RHS repeat-associated protein